MRTKHSIFDFVDTPELRKLCLDTITSKEIKAKIAEEVLDFKEFSKKVTNAWEQQNLKDYRLRSF